MADVVLEARDVQASYGPVTALRGVGFSVCEGEVVVILGANGAGKTTTMRAVCGTVTTRGSIRFFGQELVGRRPDLVARAGIAHVPQGRGTFPELSVLDNLHAGAYTRNDRSGVRNDVERWLETFPALGRYRDKPGGQLSGGEQQMLAIARALMSRPRLLLLDEPSLGLAPLIIRDLFAQLERINGEDGTTMLVVEQNANLALGIADRGYVLEAGEVTASGTAAELASDDLVRRAYLGL
jgi:branched-chain amino acid transport system ATP-binding protein